MKDRIRSILESKLTNPEKTEKLYELFFNEATEACACVIKGFIDKGE